MRRSQPLSLTIARTPVRSGPSSTLTARRLPLVAIAGASGKTSTGWLLVQLIESSGREVGAWLSDGVYLNRQLRRDELRAWELATMATRARELDQLIQEVPAVLAQSLVPGSIQIGVLTSICGSDDHCQQDVDAVRIQQAMTAVTDAIHRDGSIVATADDLMVADVARASGHPILFYALNSRNPVLSNHLDAGGNAVWIDNGWVKTSISGARHRIAMVADLPSTLNGQLIFQVQNSLAAIGAMLAIGVAPETVTESVRRSAGSQCLLSRRGAQIREHRDRTLIIDQPGSLVAIRQLVRAIRASGPKRVLHRIGPLRNLSDEEAAEAARIVGSLGGIAILTREDSLDPRMGLIKEGLMSSSNPPAVVIRERHQSTLDQVEALLAEGDIALVLDSNQGVL